MENSVSTQTSDVKPCLCHSEDANKKKNHWILRTSYCTVFISSCHFLIHAKM